MKSVSNPCPECPFARTCEPGALGGSSPDTYIGQAFGPFVLPCHKHCDFEDPDWKKKAQETPQCAGAAIFRANIDRHLFMPDAMPRAEKDTERVFTDIAEFFAHHTGCDVEVARRWFKVDRVVKLMQNQMRLAALGRKP